MKSHPSVYQVNQHEFQQIIAAQRAFKKGDSKLAIKLYAELLKENPNIVPALNNLAALVTRMGQPEEGITLYKQAIKVAPEDAIAHYQLGVAMLSKGVSLEAWDHYKWRMKVPAKGTLQERFACPMWDGESLVGKKVVIWTDSGIGDEILMGTMITELMEEPANYTIVCSVRMMPVFGRAFPGIRILNREFVRNKGVHYGYDYQISLTELGKFLRPHPQSFPLWSAYLSYRSQWMKDMRERYKAGSDDLLVGISWASLSDNEKYQAAKSLPLNDWRGILNIPNVTFVNLQYGEASKEADPFSHIITDDSVNPLEDMDRFVAQVAAMDLVITISNTTAHVAGALGVPVWNITPTSDVPIWYWFKGNERSLWYKTMTLFRRDKGEDVLPQIEKKLTDVVSNGSAVL